MDQALLKIIEQSPSMGFCLVLVLMFLKHIRDDRKLQSDQSGSQHRDNLESQEHTRDAIKDNVRVTAENTKTLERLSHAIEIRTELNPQKI